VVQRERSRLVIKIGTKWSKKRKEKENDIFAHFFVSNWILSICVSSNEGRETSREKRVGKRREDKFGKWESMRCKILLS
jgi:hypothetical protein